MVSRSLIKRVPRNHGRLRHFLGLCALSSPIVVARRSDAKIAKGPEATTRGESAPLSKLRRCWRLEHSRIVVTFAGFVYALRDQPFAKRKFRRAFEGICAKRTV